MQAMDLSHLQKKGSLQKFKFSLFNDGLKEKFRSGKVTADK
jgi:hypothetical protein